MLYDTDCFAWGLGMIRVDNTDNEGTQLITDVRNGNADFINVDTGFCNADTLFTNVDITNDFMFAYVMHQPEICIEL